MSSSLRLLQRALCSSSLLPVSCRKSKSLTQIGLSSNLSSSAFACAKTLDTKSETCSDSAHEKASDSSLATTHIRTLKEDLKLILEREIMKSTTDCLPENEIGFEVINLSENRFLLKKQAAGETIEVLVIQDAYGFKLIVNVSKMSGTCLEFYCPLHNEEIRIGRMSIKDQEHSSNMKDYHSYGCHYRHPAFKLTTDESNFWLGTWRKGSAMDLSELFDDFIEARGINKSMVKWIKNYILWKKEKSLWLENVKQFIDK